MSRILLWGNAKGKNLHSIGVSNTSRCEIISRNRFVEGEESDEAVFRAEGFEVFASLDGVGFENVGTGEVDFWWGGCGCHYV